MPRRNTFKKTSIVSPEAEVAMHRLVGDPLPIHREMTESVAMKLALLARRREEIRNPVIAVNPWKTSFHRFLMECVWTVDEARGGRIARVPEHWPHIPQLCDLLMARPRLFIDKSRRVLGSWTVCALDVWLAAGGQDDRWRGRVTDRYPGGEPVLTFGDSFRQIYLVARKFEDSDWFLEKRVKFICDQFWARGYHERWPGFPEHYYKEGELSFSNGSTITAVAQGANQLRGPGSTHVHLEELAFWEQAQMTVESLLPTLQGGGHVTAITTPQAATYASRLRNGELRGSGRSR